MNTQQVYVRILIDTPPSERKSFRSGRQDRVAGVGGRIQYGRLRNIAAPGGSISKGDLLGQTVQLGQNDGQTLLRTFFEVTN